MSVRPNIGLDRSALPILVAIASACAGSGGDTADTRTPDSAIVFPKDVRYGDPASDRGTDPATDPADDPPFEWWTPDYNGGDDPGDDPGGDDPGLPPDPGPDPTGDPGCVPKCDGKECGSNGCGGTCGSCPNGLTCSNFQCICVPQCSNKECGDNGCGGSCEVVKCAEGCTPPPSPGSGGVPQYKCMTTGPCKQADYIECEDLSIGGDIGMPTNSDTLDVYSCSPAPAHGPEKAYRFKPDQSGRVTFTLKDPQRTFMNIYLIRQSGGTCTSKECIAWSHTSIADDVVAGETYWIVVDATENNSGSFTLKIDCSWYVPPPDS